MENTPINTEHIKTAFKLMSRVEFELSRPLRGLGEMDQESVARDTVEAITELQRGIGMLNKAEYEECMKWVKSR